MVREPAALRRGQIPRGADAALCAEPRPARPAPPPRAPESYAVRRSAAEGHSSPLKVSQPRAARQAAAGWLFQEAPLMSILNLCLRGF